MNRAHLSSSVRALARRYRPVAVAAIAAAAVVAVIPPLPDDEVAGPSIAPFTDAPELPSAGSKPGLGVDGVGLPPVTSGPLPTSGTLGGPPGATDEAPRRFAPLPGRGTGGLAAGADGTVVAAVSIDGGSALAVFDRSGALLRTVATPELGTVRALAFLDPTTVVAASTQPSQVSFVDLSGVVRRQVPIPDVAPCFPMLSEVDCDASSSDQPPLPSALAIAEDLAVFVADAGQGAIWYVPAAAATARQWLVDQAFSAPASPGGPTGLALDGAQNLVIALPRSIASPDGGTVYVQAVDDGRPGVRNRLTLLGPGSHPAGVALGITGRMYLPLPEREALLVLNNEGGEVTTTVLPRALDAGTLGSVAFLGRSVLVAGTGAIVAVPVDELGGRSGGGA